MPLTIADFDAACVAHMAHGAMAGADPLTDSLYGQLEGPAEEGALPAQTQGAGPTAAQLEALRAIEADDWWLDWLMPAVIAVTVLAYAARLAGWI